jgi:hypothetical protein
MRRWISGFAKWLQRLRNLRGSGGVLPALFS